MVAPHSKFGAIRTSLTYLAALTNCEISKCNQILQQPFRLLRIAPNLLSGVTMGTSFEVQTYSSIALFVELILVDNELLLDQN